MRVVEKKWSNKNVFFLESHIFPPFTQESWFQKYTLGVDYWRNFDIFVKRYCPVELSFYFLELNCILKNILAWAILDESRENIPWNWVIDNLLRTFKYREFCREEARYQAKFDYLLALHLTYCIHQNFDVSSHCLAIELWEKCHEWLFL